MPPPHASPGPAESPADVRGEWRALDLALEAALEPFWAEPRPLTVLFSGGADSGLLAWELRERSGTRLLTVGLAGSDDLRAAEEGARVLPLPWLRHPVDDELELLAGSLRDELGSLPGPRRGIFLALAAAFANAPDPVVALGQGIDELFLGYAHFRGLSPEDAQRRSDADLRRLVDDDWPRTERLAARWGKEAHAPFLAPGFISAATAIPPVERLPATLTKPWFRSWVRHRGVPPILADRPKRAVQYGSGVDRWLRRHPIGPG